MEMTIKDVLDYIGNPVKEVIICPANYGEVGMKSCEPEELEEYERNFRIRKFGITNISLKGITLEFDLL